MSNLSNVSDLPEKRESLEKLVDVALKFYELVAIKKTFISDSLNTIFRIETPASAYALRIHPPGKHSTEAILGELYWLKALREDLSLLVPEPVPTIEGSLVLEISTPILIEPRQVVLFKWLPGEILENKISPKTLGMAGRFMAELHRHSEAFELPEKFFRPHANYKELQIWQSPSLLRHYNISTDLLTQSDYALCVETATAVTERVHHFNGPEDYGLIHGDLHQWNFLLYQDRIGALDFDDCLAGPFCLDIAIPLSYLDHRADYEQLKASFMRGYAGVRQLPQNCESGVETFLVVRALDMIIWVLSWPQIDQQPFGPELLQNSLARLRRYNQ